MGRLIIRLLAFPLTVQICWLTGLLASIGRYLHPLRQAAVDDDDGRV
jgi:hypothetical protein